MENHQIYYTGNTGKRHKNGVGIIVNNSIQSAVIGCIRQSDKRNVIQYKHSSGI